MKLLFTILFAIISFIAYSQQDAASCSSNYQLYKDEQCRLMGANNDSYRIIQNEYNSICNRNKRLGELSPILESLLACIGQQSAFVVLDPLQKLLLEQEQKIKFMMLELERIKNTPVILPNPKRCPGGNCN